MPSFDEHIAQYKKNLRILENVNEKIADSFDWQVTICFYSAVHLINAHLSKNNLQYRNHKDVEYAINYQNPLSITKLPEQEYIAYERLFVLSRRSRYLVESKDRSLYSEKARQTYERHLANSIRHLDILIEYFNKAYTLGITPIKIKCQEVNKQELKNIIT